MSSKKGNIEWIDCKFWKFGISFSSGQDSCPSESGISTTIANPSDRIWEKKTQNKNNYGDPTIDLG